MFAQENPRMVQIRTLHLTYTSIHPPQAALQSLQKKVGRADEMEQENLKIHQINLNLTGELEDYRNQTKTLLADLRAREEELTRERERETQMQSGGSGQFTSSGVS